MLLLLLLLLLLLPAIRTRVAAFPSPYRAQSPPNQQQKDAAQSITRELDIFGSSHCDCKGPSLCGVEGER
jgi:hypothetical protein